MRIILTIVLIAIPMSLVSQSRSPRALFDAYETFRVAEITSRRFTQSDLLQWLRPLEQKGVFSSREVGRSSEGRPVALLTAGAGPVKVLLWSQMHGDEPTATMALVDILSFFATYPDHPATTAIRERLTLLIIPMINPDGAERFTRRTAQRIDMNRDALAVQTPEARILKQVRDEHAPAFGFNLHDQDPRYTVGTTGTMAAIALLAPAFDESRADNDIRLRAKKVASVMAQALGELAPGHTAKWDDTFEPRAFGDNIQKWGTSTILIESGGWAGDRQKMTLRKLNAVAMLTAFISIADGSYASADVAPYEALPFNMKLGCDLLIRNISFAPKGTSSPIRADIGINFDEQVDAATGRVSLTAKVVEFGDLRTFSAFEVIDGEGALVDPTIVQIERVLSVDELRSLPGAPRPK